MHKTYWDVKWTSPFYSANVQLGEWMGIKGCLSNQQAMVTLQRMCRSRFHKLYCVTLISLLPIIKWISQFLIKGKTLPWEGERKIKKKGKRGLATLLERVDCSFCSLKVKSFLIFNNAAKFCHPVFIYSVVWFWSNGLTNYTDLLSILCYSFRKTQCSRMCNGCTFLKGELLYCSIG